MEGYLYPSPISEPLGKDSLPREPGLGPGQASLGAVEVGKQQGGRPWASLGGMEAGYVADAVGLGPALS